MTIDHKIRGVLLDSAVLASEVLTGAAVTENTGSEIERLMLTALWSRGIFTGRMRFDPCFNRLPYAALTQQVRSWIQADAGSCVATLTQQMLVGSYRADFGIATATSAHRSLVVAIECDGHEFHNADRKQVARDKARDREFTERDIRLFRFSGAEIWRDAGACADQVISFVGEWETMPLHDRAWPAGGYIPERHA